MGDGTSIEWADASWNPVRGCSRVSEGCRHCYAEGVAARFSGPGKPYHGLAVWKNHEPRWTGAVRIRKENARHAIALGKFGGKALPGAQNGRAKLTEAQVFAIRKARGLLGQRMLAALCGVSKTCIQLIHQCKHWREWPARAPGIP